jgi:hypothetical protein
MRYTKIVRQIMRKYGKTQIWVDTHSRLRSVKCYEARHGDNRMIDELTKTLDKLGIKYKIKLEQPPRYGIHSTKRIKVYLPTEK